MSITEDQALVREANELRRDRQLFMAGLEKARQPEELRQRWETHPETPYIVRTEDGAYVLSTYPENVWPERGPYGRSYVTAAETLAAHVVAAHNAALGEDEDSEPETVDAWGETSYGGTLS